MRIWRVRTESGVSWAWSEGTEGPLCRLAGSEFGLWDKTDEPIGEHLILAPVGPPAIFAVGQNYRAHAAERSAPVPERPLLFLKAPSAVQPGVSSFG